MERDDCIVLKCGVKVYGLTAEKIKSMNHYLWVTSMTNKIHAETGQDKNEIRREVQKKITVDSVELDMDKYNALIAEGRARRDAQLMKRA